MAGEVRARMVAGAAQLLAERGLQATSFSEVLERTGAPRGSLYHHFPEGKDQLVDSALELAGARAIELLERKAGESALEITEYFLYIWHEVLSRSRFSAGCAVLAVTVATDSPELLTRAAGIFRAWRGRLAELLQQGGLNPRDAASFATLLVAASEGAVVLARAEQSMEPFELVREQLLSQVRALGER
jgi:TetR/AcrR family transcriptional repressor of lmrAB and yxaGH operons